MAQNNDKNKKVFFVVFIVHFESFEKPEREKTLL